MTSLPWVTHQDFKVLLERVSSLEKDMSMIKLQLLQMQKQDKDMNHKVENTAEDVVSLCADLGKCATQTQCFIETNNFNSLHR